MGRMENARLLGGIGAVLTLAGAGFIGFILKFLAVKEIAVETGREEMLKDYIWAAVLWIASSLLLTGVFIEYWLNPPAAPRMALETIGVITFLAALLMIAGSWFLKESYTSIAEETGVKTFDTAGKLYFFGGILSLILLGFALILVAAILEALAFFRLPSEISNGE